MADPRKLALDYMPHQVRPQRRPKPTLGVNDIGQPEAYYVVRGGLESQQGYTADVMLDTARIKKRAGGDRMKESITPEDIFGVTILCPRCGHSLFLRGPACPDEGTKWKIQLDWQQMVTGLDMMVRPKLTIIGPPIVCEYYSSDFKERGNGPAIPCGWKGRIEEGICHEVTRAEIILPNRNPTT